MLPPLYRAGQLEGLLSSLQHPLSSPASPKGREVKAHCPPRLTMPGARIPSPPVPPHTSASPALGQRKASPPPKTRTNEAAWEGCPRPPPGRKSARGGRRPRRFSETSCGVPTFYHPSFFHLKIFTKLDQINILKWNFLVSKQFLP